MHGRNALSAAVFHWEDERTAMIQRLRKMVFVDGRGWTLDVVDGREQDAFDRPGAVYAAILGDGEPLACFRAIRTDGPYLAAEVFPDLAVIQPYPHRSDAWEISRFGVHPAAPGGIGRLNYALMVWFGRRVGATSLVALADLPHERLLRAIGIRTRRYGPPRIVGRDRDGRDIPAVAGEISLVAQDPRRLQALLSLAATMEIEDVSNVFGHTRVSA